MKYSVVSFLKRMIAALTAFFSMLFGGSPAARQTAIRSHNSALKKAPFGALFYPVIWSHRLSKKSAMRSHRVTNFWRKLATGASSNSSRLV